jgi:hypothetical protein
MLKLEKSRKNNEIHIRLRQSSRFLDRYLLGAFAAALSLHLLAALLFHVRLFSTSQFETILPSTRVQTHFIKGSINESDAIVGSQINKEGRLTPAQLAPPESFPSPLPLQNASLIGTIDPPSLLENNPFAAIEKDIEETYFAHWDLPVIAPAVKISVSGPLGDIPLLISNEELLKLFCPSKFSAAELKQERLVYAVELDASTGKIFWFQPEDLSVDKSFLTTAEKVLKSIVFQTDGKDFMRSGIVEITFTSGKA